MSNESEAYVLVVDDEADLADLVAINLRMAGYRVATAPDGVEALAAVDGERPDLILLDVMMPRLDGWEVLAALQERPETRDIPVVMLTALSGERDIIRGHLSGAVRYVTKPFDVTTLTGVVAEARQPLDDSHRKERTRQLRQFLTRLAELDAGRAASGSVRFSRLEGRPRSTSPSDRDAAAIAALSTRQLQVASMLAGGWDVRRIAAHLGTSRSNIYAARQRIANHLGVEPGMVASEARRLRVDEVRSEAPGP